MRCINKHSRLGAMPIRILMLVGLIGILGLVFYFHHLQQEKAQPEGNNRILGSTTGPGPDDPDFKEVDPDNGRQPNFIVIREDKVKNSAKGKGLKIGPIIPSLVQSKSRSLVPNSGAEIQIVRQRQITLEEKAKHFVLTPDGKSAIVALTKPNGKVIQINLQSGKVVRTLIKQSEEIADLAISPDGKLLAVAKEVHSELWNLRTGRKLIQFPEGILSMAFSPDGQYLATMNGKWLQIRKVSDGKVLAVFPRLREVYGFQGILWTTDGKYLACTTQENKAILLVDVATFQTLTLPTDKSSIFDMHFSSDSTKLIITLHSWTDVHVYDIATKKFSPLTKGSAMPGPIDVASQSDIVALAAFGELIHADTGRLLGKVPIKDSKSSQVAFLPQGNGLILLNKKHLTIWKLYSSPEESTLTFTESFETGVMSPDGTFLAVSFEDKTLVTGYEDRQGKASLNKTNLNSNGFLSRRENVGNHRLRKSA